MLMYRFTSCHYGQDKKKDLTLKILTIGMDWNIIFLFVSKLKLVL